MGSALQADRLGIVSFDMRLIRPLVFTVTLLALASPAWADITGFIGTATTPTTRRASGVAIGAGLIVVGFEFEYAHVREDAPAGAPELHTGMGNVYFQTPFAIVGIQPYFTTGGGFYHESLGTVDETNFGLNTGGGAKVSVFGPLRVRFDYRAFSLRGSPVFSTVHRVYVGANIKF